MAPRNSTQPAPPSPNTVGRTPRHRPLNVQHTPTGPSKKKKQKTNLVTPCPPVIQHHNFTIVAVEADWPDAEAVDRYVRHRPGRGPRASISLEEDALKAGREPAFLRFPAWMWRNVEVQGFTEWLRAWNRGKDPRGGEAVGFYGLDLYSLRRSMEAVVEYLEGVDKGMAEAVRERYGRMMVWAEDPHEYGLEALARGFKGCEEDVVKVLRDLLGKSKRNRPGVVESRMGLTDMGRAGVCGEGRGW